MRSATWFMPACFAVGFLLSCRPVLSPACCPAPPSGKQVLNADQTVVILWDAARKQQHFIRQASFKSEADEFGFLIPSPSTPELNESGNEAFPFLENLTKPEVKHRPRPMQGISCGCSAMPKSGETLAVNVLLEKQVAGFHAVVLDASSASGLTVWLKEHDYAYSPQVEAWAKPYVDKGWKITALKVAKRADEKQDKTVNAAALRMSFVTDVPLFPYREPDYGTEVAKSNPLRMLRVFFLADGRYQGSLGPEAQWTGKPVWADKLGAGDRSQVLKLLGLGDAVGPTEMHLTEFEDFWPYRKAPGDLTFAMAVDQTPLKRDPIIQYTAAASALPADATAYLLVALVFGPPLWRRLRGR